MLGFIQVSVLAGMGMRPCFCIADAINVVARRIIGIAAGYIAGNLHRNSHIHQLAFKERLLFCAETGLHRPVKQVHKVLSAQIQIFEGIGHILTCSCVFCQLHAGDLTDPGIRTVVGIDQHCLLLSVQHRSPQTGITGGVPLCIAELYSLAVGRIGIVHLGIAQTGGRIRNCNIVCQEGQIQLGFSHLIQHFFLGAVTDAAGIDLLAFLIYSRLNGHNAFVPIMVFLYGFATAGTDAGMLCLVFVGVAVTGMGMGIYIFVGDAINIVARRIGSIAAGYIAGNLHRNSHIHQLAFKERLLFCAETGLHRPVKQVHKVLSAQIQIFEGIGHILTCSCVFCQLHAGDLTDPGIRTVVGIDQHCLLLSVQHRSPQTGITGGVPLCIAQLNCLAIGRSRVVHLGIAQAG